jgi:hypothetical protein
MDPNNPPQFLPLDLVAIIATYAVECCGCLEQLGIATDDHSSICPKCKTTGYTHDGKKCRLSIWNCEGIWWCCEHDDIVDQDDSGGEEDDDYHPCFVCEKMWKNRVNGHPPQTSGFCVGNP